MPYAAEIPLFPPQASTGASCVDALFLTLTVVTGTVGLLVIGLLIYFAVKYRRRSAHDRTPRILGSLQLELAWTIIPFLVFVLIFLGGTAVYVALARPPDDALEVYVVGKQWMWKVQHTGGQREINELHVPVGRRVKLIMTSEDVIHSFFVPAFRTKADVIPGRYVQMWFEATAVGEYHLFCAEYCGTMHSGMIGKVHVLRKEDHDRWLDGRRPHGPMHDGAGAERGQPVDGSPAAEGRQLFQKLQCLACHSADADARGPILEGLYNRTVVLDDGRRVTADSAYLRESILRPWAKVAAGWKPTMPGYDGLLVDEKDRAEGVGQEEQIVRLIAYIRSLGPGETPLRTDEFPSPAQGDKETERP